MSAPCEAARRPRGRLAVGASTLVLAAAIFAVSGGGLGTASTTGEDIRYVPLERSAFVQENVIDGWVHRAGGADNTAIYGHAWDLWRALNRMTGQRQQGTPLPTWETWYSGEEAFLDNQEVSDPDSRDLDPLNQSLHSGDLAVQTGTAPRIASTVLSFNRFNRQMVDHILQNGYFDRSALQQMSDGFDLANAPPELRTVSEFPNTSVMLKPVWWIVPGDAPSMMPYWAGEDSDAATDARNPSWESWRQCVLVDPTGDAKANILRTCNEGEPGETSMKAKSYELATIATDPESSDFYAFKLTEDEVRALPQDKMILDNTNRQGKIEEVEAGDYALLVAMHVSTREIDDWTWQTFWWAPDPQHPAASPPNAQAPPPSVPPPFDHFDMCAAYYMTTPVEAEVAGEPWLCFNPYLETDLTGLLTADRSVSDEVGIHSNCQSCHRGAAFTATKTIHYVAHGFVEKTDRGLFGDGVITEFSWAMPFRAHDGPFIGPTTPAGGAEAEPPQP